MTMTYTAKAEADGVGTEDAEAVVDVDYVDEVLTVANTVDLAYLRLHGYAAPTNLLTSKGQTAGLGTAGAAAATASRYAASEPPPAGATEVTDEYLLLHGYAAEA